MAIQPEGTDLARADAMEGCDLQSGGPSINPNLRDGVIALHQRCAQFNRHLFLDGEFKAQSPTAGCRVRLSNNILDLGFFSFDVTSYAIGIDRLEPITDQVENKDPGIFASGADGSSRETGQ